MRVAEPQLRSLNDRFRGADPADLLRFVSETFGARAAILSSMQRVGLALCHVAEQAKLSFDVVFVDTGVLHPETLRARDQLARTHTHLRIVTLTPERSFAEQTREEGLLYLRRDGQERCCELRKMDPLLAIRGRYDVLVAGQRRALGGTRAIREPFGLDVRMNVLRVYPFAALDDEALAELTESPGVVENPLHAMGFPTIGCYTCTTPVRPDEPERAGRFRHLEGRESIHPDDREAFGGAIRLDDRYAALFS